MVRRRVCFGQYFTHFGTLRVTATVTVAVMAAAMEVGIVADTATMVVGIRGDTTIEWVIWEVVCALSIGPRRSWNASRRISTWKINGFQLSPSEKWKSSGEAKTLR